MKILMCVLALFMFLGCTNEKIRPDSTIQQTKLGLDGGMIDAGPPTNAGSRLQTWSMIGSDGSRQFLRMYDTDFETPCTWTFIFDIGENRCMPDAVYGVPGQNLYYQTSDCSDPGIDVVITGGSIKFVASYMTFSSTTEFRKLGAEIFGDLYYKTSYDGITTVCELGNGSYLNVVYRAFEFTTTIYTYADFVQGFEGL